MNVIQMISACGGWFATYQRGEITPIALWVWDGEKIIGMVPSETGIIPATDLPKFSGYGYDEFEEEEE